MKSFFIKFSSQTVILLTLLTLVFSPFEPLLAQAQTAFDTGTTPVTGLNGTAGATSNNPVVNATTPTTFGSASTPSNPNFSPASSIAAAAQTKPPAPAPNSNCVAWGNGAADNGGDWAQCFTDVIYVFTVGIGSGFAYVASYFFDFAVQLSLNGSAYALNFVSQGWTTARDLANMAFLFILIYIAFLVMFEAETSGTLHMLAAVIIVALLVNFSFFFTRLVIDGGNILSIQFYNAIQAPSISTTASASGVQGGVATFANGLSNAAGSTGFSSTKDLTASIMGMLNIQGLLGNASFQAWRTSNPGFLITFISLSFLYIAAAIMLWGLTVVFVSAGIKFLFRIVILWFLIIASPLAFIAYAIPNAGVNTYFKRWRGLLIEHAFYPAAFMFIFLMLTNFSNQMACNTVGGGAQANCAGLLTDIFGGLTANPNNYIASIGTAVANIAIRLGFVIAILYIGLQASKWMGVMGASIAEHAGERVGGWYSGIMKGGASLVPRTAGFAFRETVGRQAQNDINNAKKNPPTTRLGQYFDYAWRKRVLTPIANTSVGGAGSYTEIKKYRDERKGDWTTNKRDTENKEAVQRRVINTYTTSPADIAQKASDEARVKNLTKREFEAMKADDIKSIASILKEDQLKKIEDIEKFTESEKESIRREWEEKSGGASVQKANKLITDLTRLSTHPSVIAAAVAGTPIDDTVTQTLKTNLGAELDTMKAEHARAEAELRKEVNDPAATPLSKRTATSVLGAAITRLGNAEKAFKKAEELDTEREKVSAGVGGTSTAKTFIRR